MTKRRLHDSVQILLIYERNIMTNYITTEETYFVAIRYPSIEIKYLKFNRPFDEHSFVAKHGDASAFDSLAEAAMHARKISNA